MREKLFRKMLSGSIRLQSIPANDVAAAQKDLQKLSLRQLLRLRVQHIDFTPSGCGSDTVASVGNTHEAFMTMLDGRLFRLLGQRAGGGNIAGLEDEQHRLGVEAVLFVAASTSVTSSGPWCWWLTEDRRIYFDPERFESRPDFPEDGVLEVVDHSKSDAHEPTGRLVWFHWRVLAVSAEEGLTSCPLGSNASNQAATENNSDPGKRGKEQFGECSSSSVLGGMSAQVLQDMRSSLRKVGSKGSDAM